MKALVMFRDSDGHPLSGVLKKGFKHCFVCVYDGKYWIETDIVNNCVTVRVMADRTWSLEDMKNFYSNLGFNVVLTSQRAFRPSLLNPFYGTFMVANCVGLVKTVLGIHNFSWTPYSLYKELTK
jgi:hypothetical protein